VIYVNIIEDDNKILDGTAIQTWDETIKSIEILFRGRSDEDIFEFICANLAIVILVTGFESYCKQRFLELEDEGIKPNFDELVHKFIPKIELVDLKKIIIDRACDNGISPTKQLVNEDRINFQNYDNCKTAFKKAYGINFGDDLKLVNTLIEQLKNLLSYRHKIVHVSPLKAMPNLDTNGDNEIIFPSKDYATKAMKIMSEFIHALHSATLALHLKNS